MAKDEAYYNAEQKILAALETDETELNLILEGPSEIPETIGQLSSLRVLRLNGNQLTEIPEVLGQLTNLQRLYLDSNQLTEIPETIGQLSSLRVLRLNYNQLSEIPKVIGKLSNLQELNLDGNPLNPQLAAAYAKGFDAVKDYLISKKHF